jgi:DNA-binding transcriptional LysR family regulator
MERLQRVTQFWNWIPAFRAVAETEHLPTASKLLQVSPSALSRSVHLIEKNLGTSLFKREGRRIRLTHAGEKFLSTVRDAIRLVDDGLSAVTGKALAGPVHLSVAGPIIRSILPALRRLQKTHSDLVFYLHSHPPRESNTLLLRGQLDVAFLTHPRLQEGLHVEALASATSGIYCGRGHPLFGSKRPTLEQILRYPFVEHIPGESEISLEDWPPHVSRQVEMYVESMAVVVDVCASGQLLAALPDPVARSYPQRGSLRRLPPAVMSPTTYHAVRRRTLAPRGLAEVVVEAVGRELRKRLLPCK